MPYTPRAMRFLFVIIAFILLLSASGTYLLRQARAQQDAPTSPQMLPGDLDITFDTDGRVTTDFEARSDLANAVTQQADGKIVAVGYMTRSSNNFRAFAVTRYNTDGSLDTSFGTGGKVVTDFDTPTPFNAEAQEVALQPDGKIVVVGYATTTTTGFLTLARYLSNGQLDATFDTDGKVSTRFDNLNCLGFALALLSDGSILTAGYQQVAAGNDDFLLARYKPDGSIDTSFGTGGRVTTEFTGSDRAFDMVMQPDGKAILGGQRNGNLLGLARYNSDGTLDSGFGSGGRVTETLSPVRALTLQTDGKLLLVNFSTLARYQPNGTSDTTFGINGKVITSDSGTTTNAVSVVGGNKIAVGSGNFNGFVLDMFTGSGTRDTTFGVNGRVATAFTNSNATINDLLTQPDTKIVAAGSSAFTGNATSDVALTRYFGAGSCDYLITPNRQALPAAGGPGATINVVAPAGCAWTAVSNSGFLSLTSGFTGNGNGTVTFTVAANTSTTARTGTFTIAGQTFTLFQYGQGAFLSGAGALDLGFNFSGQVFTDINNSGDEGNAAVFQQDGKILVAGTARGGLTAPFVVRYLPDGTLDTSFGNGGKVIIDLGAALGTGQALALQPDGKILVAGGSGPSASGVPVDFALTRLLPDGTTDTAFGVTGRVITDFNNTTDAANSLVLQSDGKIILGGSVITASTSDFGLARYNLDGTLDTSFGTGGKATFDFGATNEEIRALALLGDGKILAAGRATVNSSAGTALVRLQTNGTLDATFGTAGRVLTFGGEARDLLVQPDGKLLIVCEPAILFRYLPDGAPDNSFGLIGKAVVFPFAGSNSNPLGNAESITLQPDNKILVGGSCFGLCVGRVLSDGSPDLSFGVNGLADAGGTVSTRVREVLLLPDGKVLLAGTQGNLSNPTASNIEVALARFFNGTNCTYTVQPKNFAFPGPGGSGSVNVAAPAGCAWTASNASANFINFTSAASGTGNGTVSFATSSANTSLGERTGSLTIAGQTVGARQLGTNVVSSGPGSHDLSFDFDGAVTTNFFGTSSESAQSVLQQPDGKILVGGSTDYNFSSEFALARYNPDGTLDTGFGLGGKVVTEITPRADVINGLALQSDGKIIAAGLATASITQSNTRTDFALTRYLPNGALDTTFGNDGRVITTINDTNSRCQGVAVQPDNKIVAVGVVQVPGASVISSDFVVARYNADGSADTSFSGGRLLTDFNNGPDSANTVLVLPDGKIIVAGQASSGPGFVGLGIAGYNANGTLDNNFGTAGKVFMSGPAATDMLRQPDGKLLLTGISGVFRFLPNGVLDNSFGLSGRARLNFTNTNGVAKLALQPDGKILVSGSSSSSNMQLTRLQADGAPDTGFGVNGLASFLNASSVSTQGLVLQADGRVILVGSTVLTFGSIGSDFILVRVNGGASCSYSINPNGQLFPKTGGSGTLNVFTQNGCPWTAVASASPNQFFSITSGNTGTGSGAISYTLPAQASFALARYGTITVAGNTYLVEQRGANQGITIDPAPGYLDESFDHDGQVITNFLANSTEEAWDMALQADGRMVVVGWAEYGFGRDFALARYNPNGSLDSSFGTNGRVVTDINGLSDEALAVEVQTDGKIIVAGSTTIGGNFGAKDWVATRYLPDGNLDTTFGNNGRVILDMVPGVSNSSNSDVAQALLIQSDGKILMVGNAYATNDFASSNFALARLNLDGSLDTTFGNNGRAFTDLNGGSDFANAAILLGDDKIVIAGTAGFTDFALTRYNANGNLDNTFGNNGRVITNISGDDNCLALAMQEDGKLVAAGQSNGSNGRFAAVRYTPAGVLDTTFGNGGIVDTAINTARAYAVAVQSNGQILLGGYAAQTFGRRNFAIARLNANGTIDGAFNLFTQGYVTALHSFTSECRAIALQTDGRLAAAGTANLETLNGSDFALARFYTNPPGTLTLGGRFTDSNNKPLRDLPVLLSGTTSRLTTTDANGMYAFDQLRAGGDYAVKSSSASYLFTPFRRDFGTLAGTLTNINFTADAAVLPPPSLLLLDDFNGPRDGNKWSVGVLTRALNSSDNAVASVSQNNQLIITPRPNVPDANYNGYVAVNNFDFTNGAASVELVQAANGGGETGFAVGAGPEYYFRFAVLPFNANPSQPEGNAPTAESPLLVMQVRNSGQFRLLSAPYNPAAHRFLRLRHVPETIPVPPANASPGGYVVFEASAANPINYTELFRIAVGPRSVAQMSVELSAGTSNPINAPGQAVFDNFAATSNASAQFMTAVYNASEAAGQVAITVTRTGDTSGGASVEYTTAGGTAQSGSRYIHTSGALTFAPNETSRSFNLPLIDNTLVDGTQTVEVVLSNARGTALNSPARAVVTITDNDTPGAANAIEEAQFFVRQQYYDFLNREPDQAGLEFWTGQITLCGADVNCIRSRRIGVSAAFFVELEFQETGYVVYRFYRAAFGSMAAPNQTRANLVFDEFTRDRSQIIAGPMLEQSTREFADRFIQREQFTAAYPLTMTNAQFVNKLFDTSNLTPFANERQAEIDALNNTGRSRAQVLFNVINLAAFRQREYNPSFVLMQYFGYLRRDPDQGGYDFWLNILNQQPQNFRGMVCAFLTSAEYQLRFGTQTPRSNMECVPGV